MGLYLWRVSYTTACAEGLLSEGGTGRRASIQKALESLGGSLESFHLARMTRIWSAPCPTTPPPWRSAYGLRRPAAHA
jgi:hypothetical protein